MIALRELVRRGVDMLVAVIINQIVTPRQVSG